MNTNWKTKVGLAAAMMAGMWQAEADDVTARISFVGSLRNTSTRQAIDGRFKGQGEYGFLNLEVELEGSIVSEVGSRDPKVNLLGEYPVEIVLKLSKSGVNLQDSFTTNVRVGQRSIIFGKYGRVSLVGKVNPRKSGRQRIRGTGTLSYDF